MLEQGAAALQRTTLEDHDDGRRERGEATLMIAGGTGDNDDEDARNVTQAMDED